MSTSGQEAGWTTDKTFVHDGDFEKVLCQRPALEVIVVCLTDSSQKAHRAGPTQLELQHAEHEALGLEDLVNGIAAINHVDDLLNGRAVDLFILGGDEDRGSSYKLEFAKRDDFAGQEAVNVVDAEEERFRQKTKSVVNLHEPVHENCAHGPLDLSLVVHIVRVRRHLDLQSVRVDSLIDSTGTYFKFSHVLKDLVAVLGNHTGIPAFILDLIRSSRSFD